MDATYEIVLAMEDAGADIVELGVPFSDPIADGPVIQRATERALKSGTSLRRIFELVRRIRAESEIPLLLFSYYNPLFHFGLQELARTAVDIGLDGVLASDLTVEEAGEFVETMSAADINTVFLAAPTSSEERIERIAHTSTGFLYAVSRTGVTGTTDQLSGELVGGFGVSRPEHVRAVWKEADGVAVGSAIVNEIERSLGRPDLAERVASLVKWMRGTQLQQVSEET
jgi:tryptophan synthase alpha chain